jgi:hypothetical protein
MLIAGRRPPSQRGWGFDILYALWRTFPSIVRTAPPVPSISRRNERARHCAWLHLRRLPPGRRGIGAGAEFLLRGRYRRGCCCSTSARW